MEDYRVNFIQEESGYGHFLEDLLDRSSQISPRSLLFLDGAVIGLRRLLPCCCFRFHRGWTVE